MPEQDPVSPNGQEDSGEEQEAQTPKQRSAWAKKEAELAAAKREAAEARQAAAQVVQFQQQNAQLQERLRQIELAQQTAGLPEEQRELAVMRAEAQRLLQQNRELQDAAAGERRNWETLLSPMARRQVALDLIEEHDLPNRIETPTGTEKMSEYLMYHPKGQTPEGMEALVKQIAGNLKRNGTAVAPKQSASAGKFLGAGGAGSATKRLTADEMTPTQVGQVRQLMRDKDLSWTQAMVAFSQSVGK